ncbi:FAD-dependent oxidoreductase [Dactylosporangium sp. NPDC051485]|uniref:FAD-dependent oxidoreductase n=1 Tax=Dactylosporangium sp. NPDC051485 TaxID=3154846 RepID=UPI003449645E
MAIVGSGPSGAYCAQVLAEHEGLDVDVHVIERLPVPYGLVRYGVAPDHQRIKSIVASFQEIFEHPRVRFFGNVQVDRDVGLEQLLAGYDAVIVASGATVDRRLGVPGEDLRRVYSATHFVSWYSGHPDAADRIFELQGDRALVIGAGNVALDVARMLCRTPDELRRTDVPEHVIEALAASSLREIHVVARRGPAFAKYTNKELMELAHLEGADLVVRPEDLELDELQQEVVTRDPLVGRRMTFLRKAAATEPRGAARSIHLRYHLAPQRILGSDAVESVQFSSAAGEQSIDAGVVFRSVGYLSAPIAGMPFDHVRGTVPHQLGRVVGADGVPVPGLYVAGWLKRGPNGVIGTNRMDAMETVGSLIEDLAARTPDEARERDATAGPVADFSGAIGWEGWQAIDAQEVRDGAAQRRDRVKVHQWERMLEVARDR